jgi:3-mercaptopyruvate sulfurtransferase SseA
MNPKKKSQRFLIMIGLAFAMLILNGCGKNPMSAEQPKDNASQTVISKKDLTDKLKNKDVVALDVRTEEAYNGWKLDGVARGGHIQGAVDFPIAWTKNAKDEQIKSILKAKGVTEDKTVVVYDNKGEQSAQAADTLKKLGYNKILIYKGGMAEWAADASLPVDGLKNYSSLVYPAWINQLIKGEKSEAAPAKDYKIFEVSWGEPKDYKLGHIPGAIHLDTNTIESEPLWNRVSDKALEAMLVKNGVTQDTTVILYGVDSTAATRAASIIMYSGVKDVRLLNGGFDAWKNAGLAVETKENQPVPVKDFGVKVPAHPEYILDMPQAKEVLADKDSKLVSIRSWDEQIGKTSGYSYIKPKGRIKGDVWGHAGSDANHMEEYRNIDNTMRNANEIAAFWKASGITSDQKRVSFYCGTGWRASEAFFDAYLMGWKNISVYDGGWFEWSMDPSNPVATGEPQ